MAPNLYLSDSGGLTAADPGPATGVGDNLPKMNYRFLGASGLYVSMVGLGLVFQESTDSGEFQKPIATVLMNMC